MKVRGTKAFKVIVYTLTNLGFVAALFYGTFGEGEGAKYAMNFFVAISWFMAIATMVPTIVLGSESREDFIARLREESTPPTRSVPQWFDSWLDALFMVACITFGHWITAVAWLVIFILSPSVNKDIYNTDNYA